MPAANAAQPKMFTRQDLERDLRAIGLQRGDVVEVHSSLSSLGCVEGGAEAVVNALTTVLSPEGTLIMTAFPLTKPLPLSEADRARGIHAVVRLFGPEYRGPSGMGVIADAFRDRDGVIVGPGFHRVCAWGKEAELHSQGLQHLLATRGKALLIGVDIHRLTSMHYAEGDLIPPEVNRCFQAPEDILSDYPPEDYYVDYGGTPHDAWGKIQSEADRRGLIRHGKVGQADCLLMVASDVVSIYAEALRTDPYGLYGVTKEG